MTACWQTVCSLPRGVVLALQRFLRRETPVIAAALAFYGLFSLFPLTLVTLATLAYLRPDIPTRGWLLVLAEAYLPAAEPIVRQNLEHLIRARSAVGLTGAVTLLWAASSVFTAMTRALGKILGKRDRPSPLRARLIGLAMAALTALLLIATLAATTYGQLIARHHGEPGYWTTGAEQTLTRDDLGLLLGGLGIAVVFCTILLAYRLIPAGAPPLRDLWPGALLATLGLALARHAFAHFITGIEQYQLIYGTIGAVIVVLLWFYVSAAIFLFGAELGGAIASLNRDTPTP